MKQFLCDFDLRLFLVPSEDLMRLKMAYGMLAPRRELLVSLGFRNTSHLLGGMLVFVLINLERNVSQNGCIGLGGDL